MIARRCQIRGRDTQLIKELLSSTNIATFKCSHHRSESWTTSPSSDTIFALSSGADRSAVAIIRLSGSFVDTALKQLSPTRDLPSPRVASLRSLWHPMTRELLDRALVLRFPGAQSYTGEDLCELHVHGGPAVIRSVLETLCGIRGLRPAKPGEFTRRAFEAGKLDLTQIEGLADLLAADTEAQRSLALAQMEGALTKLIASWRKSIISCLARVEAVLDYGEDEEISDDVAKEVFQDALSLQSELKSHLERGSMGKLVRDGVRIAILGAPNAGKSSLLNAVAGRDVAIVSHIPGTTRDALEVGLDLGGCKAILTDTAGLRETEDIIEAQGIERAASVARQAHIIIHLVEFNTRIVDQFIMDQLVGAERRGAHILTVVNKTDLGRGQEPGDVSISCKTGHGIDNLLHRLTDIVKMSVSSKEEARAGILTQMRHRHAVENAVAALDRYLGEQSRLELAAEELRETAKQLGTITGDISVDNVLDEVFSQFCIGK